MLSIIKASLKNKQTFRKRKIMPCIINAGAAFASAFLSNMEFFYHLICCDII